MTSDAVNAEEGIASRLGRHMFERRCDLDGFEPGMVELAWLNAGTREFWRLEAEHALTFAAESLGYYLQKRSGEWDFNNALQALYQEGVLEGVREAQNLLRGDA